jgi:hypothetical protein
MDPVRLACVKHAASVHPEPESNPPQKNVKSQNMTLKKYKTDRTNQKDWPHKTKKPTPIKPSQVPHNEASVRLTIKK